MLISNCLIKLVNYLMLPKSTWCPIWWKSVHSLCGKTSFLKMFAGHWNMQISTKRPHWRFCETLNYIKYRFWMDFVFAGAKSEFDSMSNEGISVPSRIWKHHRIDTCNIGEGGRSRHQRNWSLWSRETLGNQRMRKKRDRRQRSKFAPSIWKFKTKNFQTFP